VRQIYILPTAGHGCKQVTVSNEREGGEYLDKRKSGSEATVMCRGPSETGGPYGGEKSHVLSNGVIKMLKRNVAVKAWELKSKRLVMNG